MRNTYDDIKNIRAITPFLPTLGDGKPSFSIGYTLAEDGVIQHGLWLEDGNCAHTVACWLVDAKLVHSAWVSADITTPIYQRDARER